ncbi:hypothetical protein C8R43DRAFT_949461 [Mycena crocata]|nr:hypothetical protein C8R43DRAFT_949461 [Mycena crocata]
MEEFEDYEGREVVENLAEFAISVKICPALQEICEQISCKRLTFLIILGRILAEVEYEGVQFGKSRKNYAPVGVAHTINMTSETNLGAAFSVNVRNIRWYRTRTRLWVVSGSTNDWMKDDWEMMDDSVNTFNTGAGRCSIFRRVSIGNMVDLKTNSSSIILEKCWEPSKKEQRMHRKGNHWKETLDGLVDIVNPGNDFAYFHANGQLRSMSTGKP